MSDNPLFKVIFPTGQMVQIIKPNAQAMLDSCEVNIGQLCGKSRTIPAILCDGANEFDPWKLMNIVDSNGMLLDHIGIKGAVSENQAIRLCQKYFPAMENSQVRNTVDMTENAVKTFLDGAPIPSGTPYVLASDAMMLDSLGTVKSVQWDEGRLASHGGSMGQLMYDMARCDVSGELTEQMTPRDVVALLIDESCEFGGMMDAMIIKNRQLDQVIQKMAEALKAFDHEEFFVKDVTPIEPFKRNGVVNVGAIFTMSDTQTITVLFNNPDTTPAKLSADDVLTSWKWLLNKRDVTAVLQPRSVDAKKYPLIAQRMTSLLAKNHERFKRAQAARLKDELVLSGLVDQVEAGQLELRTLDSQIGEVQQQIDGIATRKQKTTEIGKIGEDGEAKSNIDALGQDICPFTVEQVCASVTNLGKQDAKSDGTAYKGARKDRDDAYNDKIKASPDMLHQIYTLYRDNPDSAPMHITALMALEKTTDYPVLLVFNVLKNLDIAKGFSDAAQEMVEAKQDQDAITARYNIHDNGKKSGSLRITARDDSYEAQLNIAGVGGEFEGNIEQIKSWLTVRLQSLGESMQGDSLSWGQTAKKLIKVSGTDYLDLENASNEQSVQMNNSDPYENASMMDLSKGIVKELVALGWEKSGSTAIKTVVLNGNEVKLKFQFTPHTAGEEIFISRDDGGESIAHFTLPEMSENGVKDRAAEMNASVEQFVQMNNESHSNQQQQKEIELARVSDRKDLAEDDPTLEDDFDPTTSEGYALIMDDQEKLTDFQDHLDSFFQGRGIDVRNNLRGLDWDGERFKELSKDGHTLKMDFKVAGAGRNIVGITYSVTGTEFSYRDDLTRSVEQLANDINDAIPGKQVPIVEGDEFGEFTDNAELRKAVKQALEDMIGQAFPCPALGKEVAVRKSGVKKIISKSGDVRKLKAIAALKELFSIAELVESKQPYLKEESNIVAYHILGAPLQLENESVNVRFVIREDDKGQYHYDHTITKAEAQNAKSPLLDGLHAATLPKSGANQDDLEKLTRNAGCQLDSSIENDQINVNMMLDSAAENLVLNMFIVDVEEKAAEVTPEPPKTGVVFKKEAEAIWRSIDYSVSDFHGHTSDEFKRARVKDRLEPKIAEAEALLPRRFRDEFQRTMVEKSIENAKKMIARWERVNNPQQYRYALVRRAAGPGSTPSEGFIGTEPGDSSIQAYARHGVAVYDRMLTDAELEQYEMKVIPTEAELVAVVTKLAIELSTHKFAPKYFEKIKNGQGGTLELMITKLRNEFYPNVLFSQPQKLLFDVTATFMQVMSNDIDPVPAAPEEPEATEVVPEVPEVAEAAPAAPEEPENEVPEMSEERQFLEGIIAGTVDMSAPDFGDKLVAMAENLDPELETLFEQAGDAYAEYAISLEI
ncbi:hypothetical protein WCE14_08925 [Acinetobacter schindleri]|uniref:defense against restriction DarA-related protein n=1 Tax=Acinetobacter schindleri TaxID=108981 RepID=UPI0034D3C33A